MKVKVHGAVIHTWASPSSSSPQYGEVRLLVPSMDYERLNLRMTGGKPLVVTFSEPSPPPKPEISYCWVVKIVRPTVSINKSIRVVEWVKSDTFMCRDSSERQRFHSEFDAAKAAEKFGGTVLRVKVTRKVVLR